MARLTSPLGVTVQVPDEMVDALVGQGFESQDSGYESLKVADLRAEIEKRNEGRDESDLLPVDGKKADLVAALEDDDSN
jgi:hypothetical protein